jgi:hypothetical protein
MEPFVKPIALPQIHWETWIASCQEYLGVSPTRQLDNAKYKLDDPASWVASLDYTKTPIKALSNGMVTGIFEHLHVTFVMVLHIEEVVAVATCSSLKITRIKAKGRDNYLCVLTGSFRDWLDAIFYFCTEETESTLRWAFNKVVNVFDHTNLKQALNGYSRQILNDGTFTIS